MEDIFQILIFVAFAAFGVIAQVRKDKKEESTASPQEVLEDMFPELTLQGEGEAMAPSVPPPTPVRRRKTKTPPPPPQAHPVQMPTKPSKQEQRVSIKNRKDARRAFIYSEIFNRKYS